MLLLAVFAFASALEESHSHKPLPVASHHLDLPTFSTHHDHRDSTLHLEAAAQNEASQCVGCLLRQRQRVLESLHTGLAGTVPGFYSGHAEDSQAPASVAHRPQASRAPPRA
jgi:hypothetical protein